MGLFGDKKDKAKEAAKEAVIDALKWPVVTIKDKAEQAYLKQKGMWITGNCAACGKPANGAQKKPGVMHKKCAKNVAANAKKWQKETTYRKDGTSKSGIHFANCTCNRNWSVHECTKLMGEPI